MQVTDIRSGGNYDQFLVESLIFGKASKTAKVEETSNNTAPITNKPNAWQKDILLTALDKLENTVSNDAKTTPLNYATAAPLDSYQDALQELQSLVSNNFEQYASKAQANLTPQDILYLFEGETNFVA